MNGIKHHRIKQNISQMGLSRRAGVSYETIKNYEDPDYPGNGGVDAYIRLSDALGVPIDELLREDFPEIPDHTAGHGMRRSVTAAPDNPITVYRDTYELTFQELAVRLGNGSTESGRKACAAETPLPKHILTLAVHEGISPDEFLATYMPKKEGN